MKTKLFCVISSVMYLSSCATIHSSKLNESNTGIVYFMPKKNLNIKVNVVPNTEATFSISSSTGYPDISQAFYISQPPNLLSKNLLDIKINNGLLSSIHAKVEPKIEDALVNLATSSGIIKRTVTLSPNACRKGETHYQYEFPITSHTQNICGSFGVEIKKLGLTQQPSGKSKIARVSEQRADKIDGIYYRINEPYLVKITDKAKVIYETIVFSPTHSQTYSLPVAHSLFATNELNLGFDNGVLTSVKEDVDAEIVAALSLPSTVVSSYTTALSNVFSAYSTRDGNKINAIKSELKVELTKIKVQNCKSAIENDDKEAIELHCQE